MKYIFLFIGLGLLLSGCEATDPKTPIRDYHANDTLLEVPPLNGPKIYYLKCDRKGSTKNSYSPIDTIVTVDERRKHISTEFTELAPFFARNNDPAPKPQPASKHIL